MSITAEPASISNNAGKPEIQLFKTDKEGTTTQVNLLWTDFAAKTFDSNHISVPELVEKNSKKLKENYLNFIYQMGIEDSNYRSMRELLALNKKLSFWWMTPLSEKNTIQQQKNPSTHIYETIKIQAFKEWMQDKDFGRANIKNIPQPSAKILKKLMINHEIDVHMDFLSARKEIISWIKSSMVFNFGKAILHLTYFIWSRRALKGSGLTDWFNAKNGTVCVSYSANTHEDMYIQKRFRSKYWGDLPELISSNDDLMFLHIFAPDHLMSTPKSAAAFFNGLNNSESNIVHVTLDSFLSISVVFKSLKKWIKIFTLSGEASRKLKGTMGILWPLYRYDFQRSFFGWHGLRMQLMHSCFQKAFLGLAEQSKGLFLQENQPWEFGFISAWKEAGHGTLIGSVHSCVAPWNLRMAIDKRSVLDEFPMPVPDITVVNSDDSNRLLAQNHYPGKVLVGEALRYQYTQLPTDNFHRSSVSAGSRIKILIIGDFTRSNTERMLDMFRLNHKDLSDGFSLTIKLHPTCRMPIEGLEHYEYIVSENALPELLASSDLAFTSNSTTGALEAYCFGIPLICMLPDNYFNLSNLALNDAVSFVATPNEFRKALIALEDSDINHRRVKRDYFCLDKNLSRWRNILGYE